MILEHTNPIMFMLPSYRFLFTAATSLYILSRIFGFDCRLFTNEFFEDIGHYLYITAWDSKKKLMVFCGMI